MRLGESSWPRLESAGGDLLVVPLGATEQHGPHLPLRTDTAIAEALAAAAADRIEGAVLAPALAYGSSGEHAGFAGTISIGSEATELLVAELCRSAGESFGRVVLVSAHGGNAVPVERAVARARGEGRDVLAWSPRWDGDAHAGHTETSLMLAIAPDLVELDRAAIGNPAPIGELLAELVASGVRGVSPNGVLGDPAGASAAAGRQLLEEAVAELVAVAGAGR